MNIEFFILDFIQEYLRSPIGDYIMPKISALGNFGIIWILIAIPLVSTKKYRKIGIAMGIALLLSLIIGNLSIKPLVARLRPFYYFPHMELLITPPHDYSFPSGHTMSSFASATVLCLYHKKACIPAYVVAALIAFSRMYLFVHFPTDILAGLVLGVLCGIIACKITNSCLIKS